MEFKEAGNALFKEKKWALAIEQYTKGLAQPGLAPDARGLLLSNRSQCQLNLGEAELAFEDADACLKLLPEHAKSVFRRACAHEKLGRPVQALSDYACVVRAEPQNTTAVEATKRLREQVMKANSQSLDEVLPANVLEDLRHVAADQAAVDKQVESCKKLRGLCVHKGLGGALLHAGALEVLVARTTAPETPEDLRCEALAVLATLVLGHEMPDEEDRSFQPPPRTDQPLAVAPAAAQARSKLFAALPLDELRPLCKPHAASLRHLSVVVGVVFDLEHQLALEVLHDALLFAEGGGVDVPLAGVSALASMCDRRRRLGRDAKALMPSGKLLKCIESALGVTSAADQLKCLLASLFTLLADQDRPKGEEVDLADVGLRIIEPFLQCSDWPMRSNGLLGLSALFATNAKAAASVLSKCPMSSVVILNAIQKPPPGEEGQIAQAYAVECLFLATSDVSTRQSLIDSGGIDTLLDALGDGQEGSSGLLRAKLVAVLAVVAAHNGDVREEIFERLDFIMELRHAMDSAREGARAARAGGPGTARQRGRPSLEESRRLIRALFESIACLSIHGEFKESLLAAKKTLKAMVDLPSAQDLSEDPAMAFFFASITHNLCRSREDKLRPKRNQFPFSEMNDDDLDAIEEFYEKMPKESRPVKNGEIDSGSAELAESLRSWCVLQNTGAEAKKAAGAQGGGAGGGSSSSASNVISHLGRCAAHGSDRVKTVVAFVFKYLVKEQKHRKYIASNGGVRTLLGLVDVQDEAARDAARQSLAQILIVTNPAFLSYSEQLDAVRPLLDLLEHKHELLQFEGAMGLTNLLSASDELRSRALQGDGWRKCRDLLFTETEMVQRAGLEALCNMCMADETIERFATGKCELDIKVFISFSQSSDVQSSLASAGALAMLCSVPEVAEQVAKAENFDKLLEVLAESEDPQMQHRTVATLCGIFVAPGVDKKLLARIRKSLSERREQLQSPQALAILASSLDGAGVSH